MTKYPEANTLPQCFKEFNTWFSTVAQFYTWGHRDVEATLSKYQLASQDKVTMELPMWCGTVLRTFLRSIHEGGRDKVFAGIASKPPKKGLSAVALDDLVKSEAETDEQSESTLATDYKAVFAEFEKWKNSYVSGTGGGDASGGIGPANEGTDLVTGGSDPVKRALPAEDNRILTLRDEIRTATLFHRKGRLRARGPGGLEG